MPMLLIVWMTVLIEKDNPSRLDTLISYIILNHYNLERLDNDGIYRSFNNLHVASYSQEKIVGFSKFISGSYIT